jgi:uncharacterized protein (DUF433 family)
MMLLDEFHFPEERPMPKTLEIVDRGRGPQLSTSRITVQDLVPYFQRRCTYEQIMEIMPVLTKEEIRLVERYIAQNREAVEEQDRRIRERNARRKNPPEIEALRQKGRSKLAALREELADKKHQERNGDRSSR